MSKIRINDLARELEVKSKAILDVLTEVGVTEKKTHSSSLEDHEADKVRAVLQGSGNGQSAKSSRAARSDADTVKPKIDLSHISKPGDVLKAILAKQQGAENYIKFLAEQTSRKDKRVSDAAQRALAAGVDLTNTSHTGILLAGGNT